MKTSLVLFSLLMIISLFFWQCQRTTYTKSDFPDQRLSFGSGGGFTGAVTSYHLLLNGQVFKSEGLLPDTTFLFSVKRADVKDLFKQAAASKLLDLDFSQPSNMYSFIGYHTEEGENQITWGGTADKTPDAVVNLYKNLKNLITEHTATK